MKDLSNVHEFARSAHRAPTEAELSHFLYTDSIAGGFNHIWIGPLLGLTVGAVGALIGKLAHGGLLRIGESGHSPLNAVLMRRRPETYPL